MSNDNSLNNRSSSDINLDDLIDQFQHLTTASTSTTKSDLVQIPPVNKMGRKEFRECVENNMVRLQYRGLMVFKKTSSLQSIDTSQKERIDLVDFVFKAVELFDGGILIKAHAILPCRDDPDKIDLNFSSCIFIDTYDVSIGKRAMTDAIRLLPDFIDGSISTPVSQFSEKYLKDRFIFKNDQSVKRFEDYSLYCRLCEVHIKSANAILDHVRQADHNLLRRRYCDRFHLCSIWHSLKMSPSLTDSCLNEIQTTEVNARTQINDLYKRCNRNVLLDTLESLKKSVEGYSLQFHLFGSYQSGLLSDENPIIDCYIDVKHRDMTETTYAEKVEVFKKLPFLNPRKYETAFIGYLVKWKTSNFDENFFFTMDPKALNAVYSSRLIALYTFLCPSALSLAVLFREWAKRLGILRSTKESKVSGAIFDYMVIYFMQKYQGIPVIDEKKTRCSLSDFLQKETDEQLLLIKGYFDKFNAEMIIPLLPYLFTDLLLFFGCGFDYVNIVQITSVENVQKDNSGFRTVKINDPLCPTTNLFHMRPEHAFHLDNMIFFACCEFLQPSDQISVENISGGIVQGFPYFVFMLKTGTHGVKNVLLGNLFCGGLRIWYPDKIPHISMKCSFCRKSNHTEASCHFLKIESIKGQKVPEKIYDIFTDVISRYFEKQRINDESLQSAMKFIRELEQIVLTKTGISLKFQPFGSLKSGFGTIDSDFDLCIKQLNEDTIETEKGLDLLRSIGDALISAGFYVNMVFGAKVPILRFKITRDATILKGDISFENHLAIRNTSLLAAYAKFDERVAPLGLAIKKWAGNCGINDASSHTFSSYALTIMLIHYLQCVNPPVLPNFQDVDEFNLKKQLINENEVQFAENVPDSYYMFFLKNFMSLGELFVGFFDYYANFDWYNQVLQIRTTQFIHKMDKGWFRLPIAIEDPFLLSHNLTASIRNINSLFIFKCFNIMQVEFRKQYSVFFNEDFNFDSESFILIVRDLNTNNRNGMACYNCKKVGHSRSKCPVEQIKQNTPRRFESSTNKQSTTAEKIASQSASNSKYVTQTTQTPQEMPRNGQAIAPTFPISYFNSNALSSQQRVIQTQTQFAHPNNYFPGTLHNNPEYYPPPRFFNQQPSMPSHNQQFNKFRYR